MKTTTAKIFCNECQQVVEARLTDGRERYPHRPDLKDIPAYTHDACDTWVGTHHKSNTPLRPMGSLATREMTKYRGRIHSVLDPIWQNNLMSRGQIYSRMSKLMGVKAYHTGELRDAREAEKALSAARKVYEEALTTSVKLMINIEKGKN